MCEIVIPSRTISRSVRKASGPAKAVRVERGKEVSASSEGSTWEYCV